MCFNGIPDVLMHQKISLCQPRSCFTTHYKETRCVQKSMGDYVFAQVCAVSLHGLTSNCVRQEEDEMNRGVALPAHVLDPCNINEINGQGDENTSFLLPESPFCVKSKAPTCGAVLPKVLSMSIIRLTFGLGCWAGTRL